MGVAALILLMFAAKWNYFHSLYCFWNSARIS